MSNGPINTPSEGLSPTLSQGKDPRDKKVKPIHSKEIRKGENTREKIIEEAINLFHEYGFVKASTRQLVKRVGMTSSAIYNHFANKDEILFTIIQRAGDKVLVTLEEVIKKYDDPYECLRQMVISMLHLLCVGLMKKEISIFNDELYQLPKDLRELCNKQHRRIFDLFRNQIYKLGEKNLINPVNPTVATFGILGATLWAYRWFKDSGKLSIEDIEEELIRLLFKGIIGVEKQN